MARNWNFFGVICLLAALGSFLMSSQAAARPDNYLKDHYSAASDGQYTCDGDAKDVGDKIAEETNPEAAEFREEGQERKYYLRYNRNMMIVTSTGDQNCHITLEDLGRVNNGAFLFLGPGFSPGSPSSSSGGSSGSGGGVK